MYPKYYFSPDEAEEVKDGVLEPEVEEDDTIDEDEDVEDEDEDDDIEEVDEDEEPTDE